MKKHLLLSLIILVLGASPAFGDEVEVIEVDGAVYLRADTESQWQDVKAGQLLKRQSQIKTGPYARCVIVFGYQRRNIVTIEQNTEIEIVKIIPGKVFLPKGRVFTLIKDLNEGDSFEVRTPTAIAGARGTGWVTEFIKGVTSISVFDDSVFVSALDAAGNVVASFNIKERFQTKIPAGATQQKIEPVKEADQQQWNKQVDKIKHFIKESASQTEPEKPVPNVLIQKFHKPAGEFDLYMKDQGFHEPDELQPMPPVGENQYFGSFDEKWDSLAGENTQNFKLNRRRKKFFDFFDKPPKPPCHCPGLCHIPPEQPCPP